MAEKAPKWLNEQGNIIQLQVSNSLTKSLQLLLANEPLTGLAAFNCVVCGEVKEGVRTQHFATAPQFLFFQLMRFVQTEDGVVKKQARVLCSSKITVPVKKDWREEVELCSYKLTAIISHIGS